MALLALSLYGGLGAYIEDVFPVGGPIELLHALIGVGDLSGLAAVHGEDKNLAAFCSFVVALHALVGKREPIP